jgi:TonB family protein
LHFSVSVLAVIVLGSGFPARAKAPSDPTDLMKMAAKVNGLHGLNEQPWNLKISFKALGENGYLMDQGTYEETWFSPIKFKRSLIGATQSLSDFGTSIGTLRSGGNLRPGDELKASAAFNDIHLAILNPLPADLFVQVSEVRGAERNVAGVQCHCVDLFQPQSAKPGYSYCFDANNGLLQATMAAWDNTQYVLKNSIQFQGRRVPGDIEIWNKGVLVLTAHLESIESLKKTDTVEFQLPTDAVLQAKTIIGSPANFKYGVFIRKVAPLYPPSARESGTEGTVVLQGVISKEGRIIRLHVISGPQILQQAAIDAVKPWMLNGAQIEVETTLRISFSLGGNH